MMHFVLGYLAGLFSFLLLMRWFFSGREYVCDVCGRRWPTPPTAKKSK
jgi:hypothetical protein